MRLALGFVSTALASTCFVHSGMNAPYVAVDCHQPRLQRRARGKVIRARDSNVEWTLDCKPSGTKCANAEHALPLVALFLENVVLLSPIRIHVKFASFCTREGCQSRRTAECASSQLIPTYSRSQTFLYPQALFKQESRYEKPRLEYFDMFITLNTDTHFHFPKDYPARMQDHHVAFVDTIVHEVNHGLGMASSLHLDSQDVVTPRLVPLKSPANRYQTEIKYYFTIYDKFVASKSRGNFSHYARQMDEDPIDLSDIQRLKENIEAYSAREAFQHLAAAVDREADLFFTTAFGIPVPLECSMRRRGGTLSHLDSATYDFTRDAVMWFRTTKGSAIHDIFARNQFWTTSPYGPHTLEILFTLGYHMNPSPVYEDSMEYHYFLHNTESLGDRLKHYVPRWLRILWNSPAD